MSKVISAADLAAMKRRAFIGKLVIGGAPDPEAVHRREARKEASLARSKRWPNTLEAQRAAKEKARQMREAEAEAKRVEIDREEEALNARKRLAVIKRANHLLASQSDKMKMLKSRRLQSDVDDVRKIQLKHKSMKDRMESEREAEWVHTLEGQLKDYDVKEKQKADHRIAMDRKIAREQQEQLDVYTKAYIDKLEEERIEGIEIKKKAEKAVVDELAEEAARKDKARRINSEMKAANERLEVLRAVQREKEAEELKAQERYAVEQEAERRRREDFVEFKRQEKEKEAAHMRKKMEDDLRARVSTEDARVAGQVKEAQEKKDAEMAMREEKRRLMTEAIDRSRANQLARKAAAKEAERVEKLRLTAQWKRVQTELDAEEMHEIEERKRAARELQRIHLEQAREKEEARRAQLARARALEKSANDKTLEQEREFSKMAAKMIDEEAGTGKNIVALSRAIHKVQHEPLLAANALV